MAIGTPWVGAAVQGNVAGSNVLTATVDVSGATNGEVVFIIGTISDAQSAVLATPSGWNALGQTSEGTTGSASSRTGIFWKIKASTDTTVVFNWTVSCRPQFVAISWPGVNTTTPTEGLVWLAHAAQVNTSYPTASATPTAADRWAVGVFSSRGSTASVAWTPDAAQTGRAAVINTATAFVGLLVADTNAAVTQAAHTYTATGQSASHGIGGVFYLIPASTGTPSGSAALSGSGTLTLAGKPASPGTLSLSGAGALTGTGAPAAPGSVALSGSGTLAPSGSPALPGSVPLSGSGQISTAGQPALPGSLPLSGSGTLGLAGAPRSTGTVALAGGGTLTGTAPTGNSGTAALAGAGTLALTGKPSAAAQLGLVGTGALGLQAGPGMKGNLQLAGIGQLATDGMPALVAALAFGGTGALSVTRTAEVIPVAPGVLVATNTGTSTHVAANAASSFLAATHPQPDLAPSNTPSSQLEVSHGV